MRKHRLAERLLVDVIGLDWEDVHIEACRWEHVMSEAVERRIVAMLDKPLVCPHGNPIPGLDQLGLPESVTGDGIKPVTLTAAATGPCEVEVDRISESLQPDADLMHRLTDAGMRPGHQIHIAPAELGVEVWVDGKSPETFDRQITDHVYVLVA